MSEIGLFVGVFLAFCGGMGIGFFIGQAAYERRTEEATARLNEILGGLEEPCIYRQQAASRDKI